MRVFSLLIAVFLLLCSDSLLCAAGRKEAVIIAVRRHRPTQPLPEQRYAETDAAALADVLSRSGYRVRLHSAQHSREAQHEFLLPFSSFIRDSITEASRSAVSQEDSLLIVLIGNAVLVPPAHAGTSSHLCFCPMDADVSRLGAQATAGQQASLMDLSEFYGALEESRAGNRLLIVDICRADPSFKSLHQYASLTTLPRIPAPNKGAGVIFSCGPGQQSVEDSNLQRGVFMNSLIQALEGKADVASSFDNGDRTITLDELSNYVRDQTSRHVSREYPASVQTAELKGMPQGMWPVVRLDEQRSMSIGLAYHSPDANASPLLQSPVGYENSQRDVSQSGQRGIDWTGIRTGPDFDRLNSAAIQQTNWTNGAGNASGGMTASNTDGKNLQRFTEYSIPFCWCPPGTFTMGDLTPGETQNVEETPVRVSFSAGFWIMQTEVTRELWQNVIPYSPWRDRIVSNDSGRLDLPASAMTYQQARDFCQALTRAEREAGRLSDLECYRLPTEAEWEYACRAGSSADYCFGNDVRELARYAAYDQSDSTRNSVTIQPVGSFRPNRWNIFDMHGNVMEMCLDSYTSRLPGGTDPLVTLVNPRGYVRRGGSFRVAAQGCTSSTRSEFAESTIHIGQGFRLVRSRIHCDTPAKSPIQNINYIDPDYRN